MSRILDELAERVVALKATMPAWECWECLAGELQEAGAPFDVQEALFEAVYSDWNHADGPPPAWVPSKEYTANTNLGQIMRELGQSDYREFHTWSVWEYPRFWESMIRRLGIAFKRGFDEIVDLSAGVESPKWLPGARMNIVDSCFTTAPEDVAIVHQSNGGPINTLTYAQLLALTNRVSGSIAALGYKPGDAIAVDMPMNAESVAIYLGIIKAGCVVVSIADSFAPAEIATRLRISEAKGIFTQDHVMRGGKRLPMYEKVVAATDVRAIVLPAMGASEASSGSSDGWIEGPIKVTLRDGDLAWADFLQGGVMEESMECSPDDRTNILFSSGTTGEPKAIPWTQTTPIKCAVDGYLHHDIRPGNRVAWPTSLGWMMGPWLIYASLINRGTVALYGGTTTRRGFGKFISEAGVNMLGVVPSLVRAWKATRCMRRLDWSAIKAFSSTGECSNSSDMLYLMSLAGYKPIIEYCGGTEIGGGYITGTVVQPCSPSTFTTPSAGLDFILMSEEGKPADAGEVMLIPPSIGLSTELVNQDHHAVYYEGMPSGPGNEVLRRHGDEIERLGKGYYQAHGRVDDTMNLGGIKVSSAELERVAAGVPGVKESAAIAVPPPGGGPDRLILYVVPSGEAEVDLRSMTTRLQHAIKSDLNRLFKLHEAILVESLPRTASNKVMRRKLRDQYASAEASSQETNQ